MRNENKSGTTRRPRATTTTSGAQKPTPEATQKATAPRREDPQATHARLVALSLREEDGADLLRALDDALAGALKGHAGPALFLLPGVQDATPPTWETDVARLGRQYRSSILFEANTGEGARYRFFNCATGRVSGSVAQRFAKARQATREEVQALLNEFAEPNTRRFVWEGRTIGVIVCGENNVVTNKQSDDNRPYIRYNLRGGLLTGADIIFNGAHSVMGVWVKLHRRFELLSRDRLAFFATNNNRGDSWKSSVRAYRRGRQIADGKLPPRRNPPRREPGVSHLCDASGDDRYRGIIVDLLRRNG